MKNIAVKFNRSNVDLVECNVKVNEGHFCKHGVPPVQLFVYCSENALRALPNAVIATVRHGVVNENDQI